MGFIETLNKFGDKIPVQKTDLYERIEEVKYFIETKGLKVKIKNEFDLFQYEIIYKGLLTQNRIENTYEMFLAQHYDLLDYLNYDEKRKMFNNDIQPILKEFPHFYDEKSETAVQLYGADIYRTDFSSLQNVYEDERHLCFYFDPLKIIYIYKKEDGQLLNHVMIKDKASQGFVDIEDVRKIAYYIETYLYQECLEFMKEKNLICEKTYKKVLKKYK